MKRILIIIGFFLISLIDLHAQSLVLGLKTGFGIANTHITNLSDSESNTNIFSPTISYSVNGILNYRSKGSWGFSIEPGIIKKGWNSNKENKNVNNNILQYLQVPILSDFYLSDKLFFSIGPEINYLLSAKNKTEYGTEKVTYLFKEIELSGIVGGTYKILNNYDIGFRYSHGITQTSEHIFWVIDEGNSNPLKLNNYNQYFQIFIKIKLKNYRK